MHLLLKQPRNERLVKGAALGRSLLRLLPEKLSLLAINLIFAAKQISVLGSDPAVLV